MLKSIMNWFKNLWGKIKGIFSDKRKLDVLIKASDISVKVTSVLKKFVEGEVDNFIAKAIPGEKDDQVVEILENTVPQFAKKMVVVNGILKTIRGDEQVANALKKHIAGLHLEGKEEFYANFAARLAMDIAKAKEDGKIEFAEVMAISQARFIELRKEGIL